MSASATTINIASQTGTLVVDSSDTTPDGKPLIVLLSNQSTTNTIYLANIPSVLPAANSSDNIPLAPGGFIVCDGTIDYYAATQAGQSAFLAVIPGASAYFQFVEILAKIIEISASVGNGLFVYNPSPGVGTLIASITPARSTDPYGNLTQPTMAFYQPGDTGKVMQLNAAGMLFNSENPSSLLSATGQIQYSIDPTAVNVGPVAIFWSPTASGSGGGQLRANWFGQSNDLTSQLPQFLITEAASPAPKTNAIFELQTTPGPGIGTQQFGFIIVTASGATTVLGTMESTDTVPRWTVDNNGTESWGSGTAATDISLSHPGSGQLKILAASASGTYEFTVQNTGTGVGGIDVIMASTGDFALAVYATGDTIPAPRVVMTALSDIRFGPGGSTSPDTIMSRLSAGVVHVANSLDVVSTVFIEDGSAPATPGTSSALYSKTGQAHYVSEDGNDYTIGAKRLASNPNQTISLVTFANVTGGALSVGAGHYRVRFYVWYASAASSGTPQFQATFPTTTAVATSVIARYTQTGVSPIVRANNSSSAISSYSVGVGPGYAGAGTNSLFEMELDLTFASSGTVQLQALSTANTFVVDSIYADLFPE